MSKIKTLFFAMEWSVNNMRYLIKIWGTLFLCTLQMDLYLPQIRQDNSFGLFTNFDSPKSKVSC